MYGVLSKGPLACLLIHPSEFDATNKQKIARSLVPQFSARQNDASHIIQHPASIIIIPYP